MLFWCLVVASESGIIIASKGSGVGEVVTACQNKAPMGLLFSIPVTWRSLLFGGNTVQKILLQSITVQTESATGGYSGCFVSIMHSAGTRCEKMGHAFPCCTLLVFHVFECVAQYTVRIAFLIMCTAKLCNICIFYQ